MCAAINEKDNIWLYQPEWLATSSMAFAFPRNYFYPLMAETLFGPPATSDAAHEKDTCLIHPIVFVYTICEFLLDLYPFRRWLKTYIIISHLFLFIKETVIWPLFIYYSKSVIIQWYIDIGISLQYRIKL